MRFRLAQPAQSDLVNSLLTSEERWGAEGRLRYTKLLAAGMRTVAANPEGPLTQSRNELSPGIRSFHLRHSRVDAQEPKVKKPVHILYYRVVQAGIVEIVRILHERMEPRRHLSAAAEE